MHETSAMMVLCRLGETVPFRIKEKRFEPTLYALYLDSK